MNQRNSHLESSSSSPGQQIHRRSSVSCSWNHGLDQHSLILHPFNNLIKINNNKIYLTQISETVLSVVNWEDGQRKRRSSNHQANEERQHISTLLSLNPSTLNHMDVTIDDNCNCDQSVADIDEETVEWDEEAKDLSFYFVLRDACNERHTVPQTQNWVQNDQLVKKCLVELSQNHLNRNFCWIFLCLLSHLQDVNVWCNDQDCCDPSEDFVTCWFKWWSQELFNCKINGNIWRYLHQHIHHVRLSRRGIVQS